MKRKVFTKQFKLEAVRLLENSGRLNSSKCFTIDNGSIKHSAISPLPNSNDAPVFLKSLSMKSGTAQTDPVHFNCSLFEIPMLHRHD